MHEETIVLPSARAIRHAQLYTESDTLFLPNYITMHSFISKLTYVEGYYTMDDDTRVLLLLEAAKFKNFQKLQIERNFFTFTKNSSYIFKFFEELAVEMYPIDTLKSADVYAEFEEHIEILEELYERYEKICQEHKLLDPIFLPKYYSFNTAFAKSHKKIIIDVAGHLTNFELQLLKEASHYTEIFIRFSASAFNTKMQNILQEEGFDVKAGYSYLLDFNAKEILQKQTHSSNTIITCEAFNEELLEIAFVKQKIYEFVQKGYDPKKIAVVLPDESRAQSLAMFDEKSNFNFAMGEPFTKSEIYTTIAAALAYIDDKTVQNYSRLERVGEQLYLLLAKCYKKPLHESSFLELMGDIRALFSRKKELQIFDEELFKFEKIVSFMQDMTLKSVLALFMQRLSSRTFDDVGGGKITVMGVLETRGIEFDAVILIDFDEQNVPRRSQKDMFLNSALRERAKLPTPKERENLQKHYYSMLFANSKEVAISYVETEQKRASRFLKELNIKANQRFDALEYATVLFSKKSSVPHSKQAIIEPYSFKGVTLSASKLKTFLECKRRYYYRYIKQIQRHEIPQDVPAEYAIGEDVHKALELLYREQNYFDSYEELKAKLEQKLNEVCGESEFEKYLIAMQKKLLETFCKSEIKRFESGWRVAYTEEPLSLEYKGIMLSGRVDRIDKKEQSLQVLDYKTGNYTLYNEKNYKSATDFQMEFYYLLASKLGNVSSCAFYNLREGYVEEEMLLREKLAVLDEHIETLLAIEELSFEMCEDIKLCTYCPYKLMCGRGL
jgi:RecB family exonuclease